MNSYKQTVAGLKASGASQEEIDNWTAGEVQKLVSSGATETEVADWLGVPRQDDPDLVAPIREYWEGISGEVKRRSAALAETVSSDVSGMKKSMVGEDFEFMEYVERGFGKSTANLALQYHTDGEFGVDAVQAMNEEPEDTGHIERAVEGLTTIGTDLPVYIAGGVAGGYLTRSTFGAGFGAGFLNGSLKSTYMEALVSGKVDNASDWWSIFVREGLKQGIKEGIMMGGAAVAPKLLGTETTAGYYASQFGAFETLKAVIEQRLPTKDELINSALVTVPLIGVDGAFKVQRMVTERSKKTNKNPAEIVDEVIRNPSMLEDAASTNIKDFRNEPLPEEVLPEQYTPETTPAPEAEPVPTARPDEAQTPAPEAEAAPTPEAVPTPETVTAPEPVVPEQTRLERDFQNIETSDAVNSITSNVRVQMPKESVLKDFKNKFVTAALDKLHPIHVAVEKARREGLDVGLVNPYMKARIQPGMENRANSFLTNGTLDFNTMRINGKSLMEVVDPIKNEADYKNAIAYLVAKRVVEKSEQGIETGMSVESARQVITELEPQFGQMQKEIVDFQNRVVDYTVEAGLISKVDADAMKEANQDYVPFFRVLDATVPDKSSGFGTAVKNPFKTMRGGEQPIFNPLESIVNNTMHHVTVAERNVAFVDFIQMVEKAPELFPEIKRVEARAKPTTVEVAEMQQAFDSPIRPEFAQGLTIFRREHGILNETQIAIFRNGKREVWEVGAELGNAFKNSNRYQANMLTKFLSVPSRFLRAGSTLAPDFMLRNFNRDTVNSAIVSDRNFIPFLHSGQGFWHILKQDKMYQEWTTSGAMQSSIVSLDRNYFQRDVKKFFTAGKVRNQISNPMELLRVMSEVAENTTRVGNYQRTMTSLKRQREREGKEWTDKEIIERSGYESRDLMDFSRIGAKLQAVNMVSAFYNARVQGYAKIYDAFKRNPKTTALKIGAYITAPSIALWYLNHNDERYKQLPQWQKDLFWIVITPEIGIGDMLYEDDNDYTIYRIPKPFELGLLFGTLPERALDWAYSTMQDKNDGSAEAFLEQIKGFVTNNTTGLIPTPDFAKPAIELFANRSLFTKMPIIPYGTEKMLPQYQYNEYTSETAKLISKALTDVTGDALGRISSPAFLDSAIQNWTGTLGRYAMQVADAGLRASGYVEGEKPEIAFEDLPVIKAFMTRNPKGSSEYISRYYKKLEKAEGLLATRDKLIAEGNIQEANKLMSESDTNLIAFTGVKETMSDLRALIKMINNNKEMSATDKRQLIDQSYQMMIDLAKQTLDVYYGIDDE